MGFTGPVRRIVTGHDEEGRAVIVADGPTRRVFDNLGLEGLVFQEIWHTTETPALIDRAQREADEAALVLAPPSGGVRIRVVDLPPEAASGDDDGDIDAAFENIAAADAKGDSDRHQSFHRTETIDFGIVLSGEIVLIMDEGETTVHPGDIAVQRGTNHGWMNRTDQPCRIAFVLIDGRYADDLA